MAAVKLTPTQQAFYDLMRDGQRHGMPEFINLLPDELSGAPGVHVHITNLRKALEGTIYDVICEQAFRRTTYRLVRKLYDESVPNPPSK